MLSNVKKEYTSIVHCRLPKAGLGNILFPLMKSLVFCELNRFPLIVTGYHPIRLGPYIRFEKRKRKYVGFFNFEKSILREKIDLLKVYNFARKNYIVHNPPLEKIHEQDQPCVYIIDAIPSWKDYFAELRQHREIIKSKFNSILTEKVKNYLRLLHKPCIGVHVRYGDWKIAGYTVYPEEYYIDVIKKIREISGKVLPVTIFTDAFTHEINKILSLPNVKVSNHKFDIADLILLSESKIIIPTCGSTFSLWACFLSESPIILPDGCKTGQIRKDNNHFLYEGTLEAANDLLYHYIRSL